MVVRMYTTWHEYGLRRYFFELFMGLESINSSMALSR